MALANVDGLNTSIDSMNVAPTMLDEIEEVEENIEVEKCWAIVTRATEAELTTIVSDTVDCPINWKQHTVEELMEEGKRQTKTMFTWTIEDGKIHATSVLGTITMWLNWQGSTVLTKFSNPILKNKAFPRIAERYVQQSVEFLKEQMSSEHQLNVWASTLNSETKKLVLHKLSNFIRQISNDSDSLQEKENYSKQQYRLLHKIDVSGDSESDTDSGYESAEQEFENDIPGKKFFYINFPVMTGLLEKYVQDSMTEPDVLTSWQKNENTELLQFFGPAGLILEDRKSVV